MLAGILLAIHGGALVLLVFVPIGWTPRFLLWGVLIWSFYSTLVTHVLRRGPKSIQTIELDNEGGAAVRLAGSEAWLPARIVSHFVHPWITLLSLRLDARRWPVSLVIARDAVEAEPFRRWRVALKHRAAEG